MEDVPSDDLLTPEDLVMLLDEAMADQLQAFNEELAESGWQARVKLPSSGHVCLRLERPIEGVREAAPPALEICRRTFEAAAKSARKHTHKQA
jgi:hypothetical protein